MRTRRAMLLGGVFLASLFGAGCPSRPSLAPDTESPKVVGISFDPSSLKFVGGEVTITAQVSDNKGVKRVWGEVEKPDGTKDTLQEKVYDPPQESVTYQATYDFPANTGNKDVVYTIRIKAADGAGNEREEKETLVVPAPEGPPEPPFR